VKVYLAAIRSFHLREDHSVMYGVYTLSSFFEYRSGRRVDDYQLQPTHILDSGAFSTFKEPEKAKNYDWDGYVKHYIAFIKKTGQKLFFELDIDCVVGLKKVEYYRKQIEDCTGIAPVPVWHDNRKWDYFEMMCENSQYVAIGTVPTGNQGKHIRKNPLVLQKFITTAHRSGAKIHGLGFTQTECLKYLPFDSVDSISWKSGALFGYIYQFTGDRMIYRTPPKDKKTIDYHIIDEHNFNEWVKFQKYADTNL
jgi:hypothetical protein